MEFYQSIYNLYGTFYTNCRWSRRVLTIKVITQCYIIFSSNFVLSHVLSYITTSIFIGKASFTDFTSPIVYFTPVLFDLIYMRYDPKMERQITNRVSTNQVHSIDRLIPPLTERLYKPFIGLSKISIFFICKKICRIAKKCSMHITLRK